MPYRIDNVDPRSTVMIVVDMQNDFVAEGAKLQSAQAHAMVPKLAATLRFCREKGIRVVYTAHVHRSDGCDMGLYDDLYSVVADRSVLVDGSPGAEIYKDLAPAPGEHVIKKHRYSAFFATDLDLILREWGVKTVIISGTTTEKCCHATARDAMFRNYQVAFLSDATGTFDYPDVGQGALSAADVHRATLTILAFSTADVMTVDESTRGRCQCRRGEQGGVTGTASGKQPGFCSAKSGETARASAGDPGFAALNIGLRPRYSGAERSDSRPGAGRGDGTPSPSQLRLDASTRRGARCVDNIN
jgi:biuret amidohydrolase